MPNDWSKFSPENMDVIRQFVRDQKKSQGLAFAVAAGTVTRQSLNVQQQGRFLLGLGFVNVNGFNTGVPDGPVNILINEEKFISTSNGYFLDVSKINEEFYWYPRPMTGIQKIDVEVVNSLAGTIQFNVWYI